MVCSANSKQAVWPPQRAQWKAKGDVSQDNGEPGYGGPPKLLYSLTFALNEMESSAEL